MPGSFELPFGASSVIQGGVVDAVICIGNTGQFDFDVEPNHHGVATFRTVCLLLVATGVLIKGETMHFGTNALVEKTAHRLTTLFLTAEYIAGAASQGIMDVGLKYNVPVIFGILTCLTEQQALARAGKFLFCFFVLLWKHPILGLTPNGHNHGVDWGLSAIEMVGLKNSS